MRNICLSLKIWYEYIRIHLHDIHVHVHVPYCTYWLWIPSVWAASLRPHIFGQPSCELLKGRLKVGPSLGETSGPKSLFWRVDDAYVYVYIYIYIWIRVLVIVWYFFVCVCVCTICYTVQFPKLRVAKKWTILHNLAACSTSRSWL